MDDKSISEIEAFVIELIFVNLDCLDVFFHNFVVKDIVSYLIHNLSELAFHFLSKLAFEVMYYVK